MERLQDILGFFQQPEELSFWDVFAVVILLAFLVIAFVLALREWRMRSRAHARPPAVRSAGGGDDETNRAALARAHPRADHLCFSSTRRGRSSRRR